MTFNKPIKPATDIDSVRRSALWHLGRRDHSEQELRKKLGRKTDNQQWIDTVISACYELGYLDDKRFTENYIRTAQHKGLGINRIKRDLTSKGIDPSNLAEVINDASIDAISSAVNLLAKKYDKALISPYLKQQAMGYLQNKGHLFEHIPEAIAQHNIAHPEPEETILEEAVRLISRKFYDQITEKKTHDKALRFLISRGYNFSLALEAIVAFNEQLMQDRINGE